MRSSVIAVVRDLKPLTPEEEQRLLTLTPEEFRKLFQENAGRILALARLRQSEPELYGVKVREMVVGRDAEDLAAELRGNANPDAASVDRLRQLAAELVDLRTKARELEIGHLERRIARMRADLEADRARRAELIDERIQSLQSVEPKGRHGRDGRERSGREG